MQYYIIEIQQYDNGEYGHLVHYAYDENLDKARLKGESIYYQVLAAAAISEIPSHAAIMFTADGFLIMHQSYKHKIEHKDTVEE